MAMKIDGDEDLLLDFSSVKEVQLIGRGWRRE